MGLCGKVLLVFVVSVYVFSGSAEAWSWSWGSGGGWGIGWSSNGNDTNWSWATPVSHGSGSTHNGSPGSSTNNHTAPPNQSSNHTAPSNQPSNHTAPPNHSNNNTAPSNHSSGTGSTSKGHHKHTVHTVTVWKKGFNYEEWVAKREPFYVNDVLIFKYSHNEMENNVYLVSDLWGFMQCDVWRGEKLTASSSPLGFKLVLSKPQPYYFTNGEYVCNQNNMMFSITPIQH